MLSLIVPLLFVFSLSAQFFLKNRFFSRRHEKKVFHIYMWTNIFFGVMFAIIMKEFSVNAIDVLVSGFGIFYFAFVAGRSFT